MMEIVSSLTIVFVVTRALFVFEMANDLAGARCSCKKATVDQNIHDCLPLGLYSVARYFVAVTPSFKCTYALLF